jgi:hypothetical protein
MIEGDMLRDSGASRRKGGWKKRREVASDVEERSAKAWHERRVLIVHLGKRKLR